MTTANKITLTRIAMIPLFIYFALVPKPGYDAVALTLFILASVTDFLDGYIARKYNQITDFGKFIDPLADKLLICAALLVFVDRDLMSGVLAFIILAREFMITSLRTVAMGKGKVMAATWTGKVKTCVQIAAVIVIFLTQIFTNAGDLMLVSDIAAWVMTLVTLYSGYDYISKNWAIIADGASQNA